MTETMTTIQTLAVGGLAVAGALAAVAVIACGILRCPRCHRWHDSAEEETNCQGDCRHD